MDPKKKDAQKRLPDAQKCAAFVREAHRLLKSRQYKHAVDALTHAIDVRVPCHC